MTKHDSYTALLSSGESSGRLLDQQVYMLPPSQNGCLLWIPKGCSVTITTPQKQSIASTPFLPGDNEQLLLLRQTQPQVPTANIPRSLVPPSCRPTPMPAPERHQRLVGAEQQPVEPASKTRRLSPGDDPAIPSLPFGQKQRRSAPRIPKSPLSRQALTEFELRLSQCIGQHTLPLWNPTAQAEDRQTLLINNLLYFCGARERARYKREGREEKDLPKLLQDQRFHDRFIAGDSSTGVKPQQFCNIHREDDRVSADILGYMKTHPLFTALLTEPSDTRIKDLLLYLIIIRIFNTVEAAKTFGSFTIDSLAEKQEQLVVRMKQIKRRPAYILNTVFGKLGMNLSQFVFELLPLAVKNVQLPKPTPMAIDTLSRRLNQSLIEAVPLWFAQQPNHIATHTLSPLGNSSQDPEQEKTFDFKLENNQVVRRKNRTTDDFVAKQKVTPQILNYGFNFSQAVADMAVLFPAVVDLNSGTIGGPGTKNAIVRLYACSGTDKIKQITDNCQSAFEALYGRIARQWPREELGHFNRVTLEHLLCEWNRWLECHLGLRSLKRPYTPWSPIP